MKHVIIIAALATLTLNAQAQIMISGNEAKIDLHTGAIRVVQDPGPDSISILDFDYFPPRAHHIEGIRNSVIGPPSNIAITPDESLALIASSLVVDPNDSTAWIPDNIIHVLDLTLDPPQVIDEVEVDQQPSGMSITRDGKFALVANRAAGTVSLLTINGKEVTLTATEKICEPLDEVSDIAIHPTQNYAIASICQAGYLAVFDFDATGITLREQKLTTFGKPYRVIISPDGDFALTAGSGQGIPDADAVSVIDLRLEPIRTVDYITVPSGPESLEISPDGQMVAVVLMNGTNTAPEHPHHNARSLLVILTREGDSFVQTQELPGPRIPEGVAFSSDGKYLAVQSHRDKEIAIYDIQYGKVYDNNEQVAVPAFASSLRSPDKPFSPPASSAADPE